MAYLNTTRAANATSRGGIAGVLQSLHTTIERRRLYGRTFRELAALSDRELADLGMHRSMIAAIAHEAAYGK